MTPRPPSSGRRVGAGRVRVDAARAIAKLRDFQLADRHAWVLDAVRAAVASGAARVELTGDANDVWVAWAGEPWPAALLPRLFDELVSPELPGDGQRLRLLATAVNSALGLEPAYVDVYAVPAGGAATRARYTPSMLELPSSDTESPQLAVARTEHATAPAPALAPGMLVHLRRRVGLDALGNLLRGEPRELGIARAACADLPVPLRIGGAELASDTGERDVVRVELGHGLDGFLALTQTAGAQPTGPPELALAERGVVIVRLPLELGLPEPRTPVPLRAFVDAPRLPTNASRSDVRRDAHPVPAALSAAAAAFPELCDRLVAALSNTDEPDPGLRDGALALIAAAIAGSGWTARLAALTGPLRALADLPLVRNAVGHARPVRSAWNELLVHTGDRPYPGELAPWLADALWAPATDPATRALIGVPVNRRWIRAAVRDAWRDLRAQHRFLAHAPRPARLRRPQRYWVIGRTDARSDDSCADGLPGALDGEVCLVARGRRGTIALLLRGREIEEVTVDASVPFTAVVDAPALTPADGYRGVARDHRFADVCAAVTRAVIMAAEAVAEALETGALRPDFELHAASVADSDRAGELVRRATRLAVDTVGSLGNTPLARARVWRTVDGRPVSLWELGSERAIGTVVPGATLASPVHRTLVACSDDERALLRDVLEPITAVVPYDAVLLPRHADTAMALAGSLVVNADIAALAITEQRVRGAIAWGSGASRLRLFHAGVCLGEREHEPDLVPCELAVDADDAIPDDTWTAVRDDGGAAARDWAPWETALARAVARALVGDPPPEPVTLHGAPSADAGATRALLGALAAAPEPAAWLGDELFERLRAAPLFATFGGPRVSAMQLADAFPEVIPCLASAPVVPPLPDWHPLLGDALIAYGAATLSGRPTMDASAELARRLRAAERARRIAAHRAVAPRPLTVPGAHLQPVEVAGIRGVVGPSDREGLDLTVCVEGRPFAHVVLPGELRLTAVCDIDPSLTDEPFTTVPDPTLRRLEQLARAAVPALLRSATSANPRVLTEDHALRALTIAWLEQLRDDPHAPELRTPLADTAVFTTLRGGLAAVGACVVAERVRTAAWFGDWLPPADGEPPSWLDDPILQVAPGDELARLIPLLAGTRASDVTSEARTLQRSRRVAHGLLRKPTVEGALPALARALAALGASIGPGEIALVAETSSRVVVFADGHERGELRVPVVPAVCVALESPELAAELTGGAVPEASLQPLVRELQRLAWRLAGDVVKPDGVRALPTWVRYALARALLAGAAGGHTGAAERIVDVFETTAGERVGWRQLQEQHERFGDVWVTGPSSTARPLDDRRIAVRLTEDERPERFDCGLAIVDATRELELDEAARANRDRPAATELALPHGERGRVLAVAALRGDGVSEPRGVVAPLLPDAAELRTARVHRAMHPLGIIDDPCAWPTVSVVDDARLAANRTWTGPERDDALAALLGAIRRASEGAIARAIEAPGDALTSRALTDKLRAVQLAQRDHGAVVRGRLWLLGEPGAGSLRVRVGTGSSTGTATHASGGVALPLPVHGVVLAHTASGDLSRDALAAIAGDVYPDLIRQLRRRKHVDRELVAAHLAYALATGLVAPDAAGDERFPCVVGAPLTAQQLAELLRDDAPVDPESVRAADTPLVRTVRQLLGARLAHGDAGEDELIELSRDDLEPIDDEAVAPSPARLLDPLDQLAFAVYRRLAQVGLGHALDGVRAAADRRRPIAAVRDRTVYLAGADPRLRAIAAAGAETHPAVDALVAHIATLLNDALTDVTDAVEHHALVGLLRATARPQSSSGAGAGPASRR